MIEGQTEAQPGSRLDAVVSNHHRLAQQTADAQNGSLRRRDDGRKGIHPMQAAVHSPAVRCLTGRARTRTLMRNGKSWSRHAFSVILKLQPFRSAQADLAAERPVAPNSFGGSPAATIPVGAGRPCGGTPRSPEFIRRPGSEPWPRAPGPCDRPSPGVRQQDHARQSRHRPDDGTPRPALTRPPPERCAGGSRVTNP